jgi:hypothetical protein
MTDDPGSSRTAGNRVSIRAVLAFDGEDVTQALSRAGIFDPVAVPATLGNTGDPQGGILGDGMTPNLIAEIEPDDLPPDAEADPGRMGSAQRQDEAATAAAPAAVDGMRSFAPTRGRRR